MVALFIVLCLSGAASTLSNASSSTIPPAQLSLLMTEVAESVFDAVRSNSDGGSSKVLGTGFRAKLLLECIGTGGGGRRSEGADSLSGCVGSSGTPSICGKVVCCGD